MTARQDIRRRRRPAKTGHPARILLGAAAIGMVLAAEAVPARAQSEMDTILLPTGDSETNGPVVTFDPANESLSITNSRQLSAIVQIGTNNQAGAAILNSPASTSAQTQIGHANDSTVQIAGGAGNNVKINQLGNFQSSGVFLVNSYGTEVIQQQSGKTPSTGGVLIINGYPGLKVGLN